MQRSSNRIVWKYKWTEQQHYKRQCTNNRKVWVLVEQIREKHERWQIGNKYLCPRTCDCGSNLKLVIGGFNTQPYTDGSGARKGLVYRG